MIALLIEVSNLITVSTFVKVWILLKLS